MLWRESIMLNARKTNKNKQKNMCLMCIDLTQIINIKCNKNDKESLCVLFSIHIFAMHGLNLQCMFFPDVKNSITEISLCLYSVKKIKKNKKKLYSHLIWHRCWTCKHKNLHAIRFKNLFKTRGSTMSHSKVITNRIILGRD